MPGINFNKGESDQLVGLVADPGDKESYRVFKDKVDAYARTRFRACNVCLKKYKFSSKRSRFCSSRCRVKNFYRSKN